MEICQRHCPATPSSPPAPVGGGTRKLQSSLKRRSKRWGCVAVGGCEIRSTTERMIEILEIMGYVPPINWCRLILETWMSSSLETWTFSVILDKLIHLFMDIYGYKIPWTLIYWALFKQHMLMVGNLMFSRGITENTKKNAGRSEGLNGSSHSVSILWMHGF